MIIARIYYHFNSVDRRSEYGIVIDQGYSGQSWVWFYIGAFFKGKEHDIFMHDFGYDKTTKCIKEYKIGSSAQLLAERIVDAIKMHRLMSLKKKK